MVASGGRDGRQAFLLVFDQAGQLAVSTVRELFESAVMNTEILSVYRHRLELAGADQPRSVYRDRGTEEAWRLFQIGVRCRERVNASIGLGGHGGSRQHGGGLGE